MTKLDRYIFKAVAMPFGISVLGAIAIVLLFRLERLLGAALGFGMTLWDAGIIFVAALPPFLVLALPIGLLISILVGYGRMNVDHELVALRASGQGPVALARVPLVMGIVVTGLCLPLSHFGEPFGLRVLHQRLTAVALRNISEAIRPGEFNERFDGVALYASGRRPDGALSDVLVFDTRDAAQPLLLVSARGRLEAPTQDAVAFTLTDGELHLGGGRGDLYDRLRFRGATLPINVARELQRRTEIAGDIGQWSSGALLAEVERLGPTHRTARRLLKTYGRRFAFPLMALVFAIAAAAIALSAAPKSKTRNASWAIGTVAGYYILVRIGDYAVSHYEGTALAAAFVPNLIVLALAAFGLKRAGAPR